MLNHHNHPPTNQPKKPPKPPPPPILQIDPGGHKALIRDVAFTPDGRYLVSASNDKVIRVWDIETGETVRMFRGQIGAGHEGKIYAMALSPDGQWLAVGGWMKIPGEEGHQIRLYNFASGQLVALLKGHTNVVLSLAFSPDSRFLVSGQGGSYNQIAILWDLASKVSALGGAKATVLDAKHTLTGHTDHIYAVAFTPDSQRVVTGSDDHTLRLWQVADGKRLATLTGHTDKVYSVAISPQDGTIASGSVDYTIRLWEGQTGRLIKTLANQDANVSSLSFSPDGRYLISGVGGKGSNTHCHVWSIPDGQEIVTYRGHDNVVIATAVSPDGRWVATGGGDNQEIHLWSLREGQLKQRLRGVGASTWAVGFSADGRELAWGNTSFDYQRANYRGPLEYQLALPKAKALDSNNANALVPRQLTKEGQRFLRAQDVHDDWTLRTRQGGNYGYQAIIDIRHHNRTVANIERGSTDGEAHRSYTFTPNGQRIISGGNHGVITAYNRKGKKLGNYVGHTGDVWAVAVSPDGRLLVSGGVDQTVRLWDVDSRENLLTLFHGNNGEWVAWTPTGHYTASPNGDEMVGWQINRGVDRAADYVKAAQLREYFYRPDIVANAIRWRDVSRAVAHAGGSSFQLAQLNVTKAPDFNIIAPPNHSTTRRAQLEVKLSFVDTGEPLDTLQAYVNGRLIDNLKKWALPQRRNSFEKTVTLPLRPGPNQIKIIAKNRLKLMSEQTLQVKLVNPAAEQAGTLYLVAVGVSRYQDEARNLRFAATDAQAFHQLMLAQQGKRYRQVKHRLLADDATRPTAANIKQALELFQQAEPQDTVVLFLSGHGDYDGSNYYFLPYDARQQGSQWQADTVIDWRVLQQALQEAKGRRVLLVDTCHAGGAFNPRLIKDASDHEIVVLSATDSVSVAQELIELGHGVFTYALLKGLEGKADLVGDDQIITINELYTYLDFFIKEVTDHSQVPISNSTSGFKNFEFSTAD